MLPIGSTHAHVSPQQHQACMRTRAMQHTTAGPHSKDTKTADLRPAIHASMATAGLRCGAPSLRHSLRLPSAWAASSCKPPALPRCCPPTRRGTICSTRDWVWPWAVSSRPGAGSWPYAQAPAAPVSSILEVPCPSPGSAAAAEGCSGGRAVHCKEQRRKHVQLEARQPCLHHQQDVLRTCSTMAKSSNLQRMMPRRGRTTLGGCSRGSSACS